MDGPGRDAAGVQAMSADPAVIAYQQAANDHAFNLAAALAEMAEFLHAAQLASTAAAVLVSDALLALQAFHAWVECTHETA